MKLLVAVGFQIGELTSEACESPLGVGSALLCCQYPSLLIINFPVEMHRDLLAANTQLLGVLLPEHALTDLQLLGNCATQVREISEVIRRVPGKRAFRLFEGCVEQGFRASSGQNLVC